MRNVLLILSLCVLTACDNNEPKVNDNDQTEPTAQEQSDNALIKLQNDTTKRAEDTVNDALQKQQQALDSIDK